MINYHLKNLNSITFQLSRIVSSYKRITPRREININSMLENIYEKILTIIKMNPDHFRLHVLNYLKTIRYFFSISKFIIKLPRCSGDFKENQVSLMIKRKMSLYEALSQSFPGNQNIVMISYSLFHK